MVSSCLRKIDPVSYAATENVSCVGPEYSARGILGVISVVCCPTATYPSCCCSAVPTTTFIWKIRKKYLLLNPAQAYFTPTYVFRFRFNNPCYSSNNASVFTLLFFWSNSLFVSLVMSITQVLYEWFFFRRVLSLSVQRKKYLLKDVSYSILSQF